MPTRTVTLSEAEQRALSDALGENWEEIRETLAQHITEEDADALYEKLTGEQP